MTVKKTGRVVLLDIAVSFSFSSKLYSMFFRLQKSVYICTYLRTLLLAVFNKRYFELQLLQVAIRNNLICRLTFVQSVL